MGRRSTLDKIIYRTKVKERKTPLIVVIDLTVTNGLYLCIGIIMKQTHNNKTFPLQIL